MSDHTTMPHGATLTLPAGDDKDAEIERLRADLAEAEALLLDIGSRDWWQRRAAWWKQRDAWLARKGEA